MDRYWYLIAIAVYVLLIDLVILAIAWRDRRHGRADSGRRMLGSRRSLT